MQVEYSGWVQGYGKFCCQIYVDENKTDYQIHYKNGMVAKQNSAFSEVTADWNHDGDVYSQFGAYFNCFDKKGQFSGVDFWTPVDMVSAVVEAKSKDPSRIYGNEVIDIPGIDIPPLKKRPSLDEQLLRCEKRKEAMEVEKNRKMKSLGIRSSNEPWAR